MIITPERITERMGPMAEVSSSDDGVWRKDDSPSTQYQVTLLGRDAICCVKGSDGFFFRMTATTIDELDEFLHYARDCYHRDLAIDALQREIDRLSEGGLLGNTYSITDEHGLRGPRSALQSSDYYERSEGEASYGLLVPIRTKDRS